ncbi:TPA: exotoxin, partial [Streptococcus pyogenes]|nr:exotoxin [Streptococcus pyogenes]HEQ6372058.1 exotoxin [Streptococcus pyogenes]
FKIRKFLMESKEIHLTKSPYIRGSLEIHSKNRKDEKINLYDAKPNSTRSDVLKKYKDNKTINMKDFSHFDIYLWTK